METTERRKQALEIAKRLVDYKLTNDLDVIAEITQLCKEEVTTYILHNNKNKKNSQTMNSLA